MPPPAIQAGQTEGRLVPDLRDLDKVAPIAASLNVPRPVWISPPSQGFRDWTISSQAQNRPLRVTYWVAADSGLVTGKKTFAGENITDKAVNVAIAAHEGQLFGRLNQAILLLTSIGLLLMSVSAAVMWWRRRPNVVLGAPAPVARPRFSGLLAAAIAALTLLLPMFGVSLLLVISVDLVLLRRLPSVRRWLGLEPNAA